MRIARQRWQLILARPVYSLMLGTKPTIILSSDLAIKELLDKRGNIYSDRPHMFLSQDVASGGHRLVVMVSLAFLACPCIGLADVQCERLIVLRNMGIRGERSTSWCTTF